MIDLDDVASLISQLPEVREGERHGMRTWYVGDKSFAWERPLTKADIKRYGSETPPEGPLLALYVEDLDAKEAMLAESLNGVFTIPHFDGYRAVLVQLRIVHKATLKRLIRDAWLAQAQESLARAHLASVLKLS